MKKQKWNSYAAWIAFAEIVGGISGWLIRENTRLYSAVLKKPPLSPPGIVFPIVWTILFALMGIGAARVYQAPASNARSRSLLLFFIQLAFNFCWSIIFFNFQNFGLAFFWLLALWGWILWMIRSFRRVDAAAAWLQVPYLLWAAFAAYLNFGVWMLNR
ncbi:TspO/MBR family protein [Dysosmobacter sp.]